MTQTQKTALYHVVCTHFLTVSLAAYIPPGKANTSSIVLSLFPTQKGGHTSSDRVRWRTQFLSQFHLMHTGEVEAFLEAAWHCHFSPGLKRSFIRQRENSGGGVIKATRVKAGWLVFVSVNQTSGTDHLSTLWAWLVLLPALCAPRACFQAYKESKRERNWEKCSFHREEKAVAVWCYRFLLVCLVCTLYRIGSVAGKFTSSKMDPKKTLGGSCFTIDYLLCCTSYGFLNHRLE